MELWNRQYLIYPYYKMKCIKNIHHKDILSLKKSSSFIHTPFIFFFRLGKTYNSFFLVVGPLRLGYPPPPVWLSCSWGFGHFFLTEKNGSRSFTAPPLSGPTIKKNFASSLREVEKVCEDDQFHCASGECINIGKRGQTFFNGSNKGWIFFPPGLPPPGLCG